MCADGEEQVTPARFSRFHGGLLSSWCQSTCPCAVFHAKVTACADCKAQAPKPQASSCKDECSCLHSLKLHKIHDDPQTPPPALCMSSRKSQRAAHSASERLLLLGTQLRTPRGRAHLKFEVKRAHCQAHAHASQAFLTRS